METQKDIKKIEETGVEKITKYYKDPNVFISHQQKLSEYDNLENTKEELTPAQQKRKTELITEISMLYGLENGIWTANLSHAKYYASLAHMRSGVVKDFGCQTSLELMLADRIVAHYWRAMRYDSRLNRLTENEDGGCSFNQQRINFIKELHRGVELSDRQLNANIILLKELKQPRINIKVTTENAFIAQNQQINNLENKNNEAK